MQPHLRGLGLENFRVFADYQWFDFAPITILTGPNSSGKSSILKALLLMEDNLQRGTLLPTEEEIIFLKKKYLKFDGIQHDLSSGKIVLNDKSKSDKFSLRIPYQVDLNTHGVRYFLLELNYIIKDTQTEFLKLFSIHSLTGELVYRFDRQNVFFDFDLFLKILDLPNVEYDQSIHQDRFKSKKGKLPSRKKNESDFIVDLMILKSVTEWKICSTNDYYKFWLEPNEDGWDGFEMNEGIENTKYSALASLIRRNTIHTEIDEINLRIYSDAILFFLGISRSRLLDDGDGLNSEWSPSFTERFNKIKNLIYLPSIKGQSKRSYHASDDYILNSLMKTYFEERVSIEYSDFLKNSLKSFNLESLSPERYDEINQNYIQVNGRKLADLGFGITQISAIILQLAVAKKAKLMLFEEPESNLHPRFQSQLANLFLDAQKLFKHQFIIETHSEYMIRKFQYLVAKREMKPEDVVIYYLYGPNDISKGEKQVKKIEILSDGSLSDDFGPGFFDEAANWELELLRLKKNRIRQN